MTTSTSRPPKRTTRPPAPWQPPTQLHELADTGLVASVYLWTRNDVCDGADRVLARWQGMRRQLGDEGAPESMLLALDRCLRQALVRGETMAAFANAAGLSHVEHLPPPARGDWATVAPVPQVLPVLAARQREVPVVVALIDRHGADLAVVEPGVPVLEGRISGQDPDATGPDPDGWDEHGLRARVESRRGTARAASEALTRLVDAARARLVVVAGDGGGKHLVRSHLPPRITARLVELREDHGSAVPLVARARTLAAQAAAREEDAVLGDLSARLPHGRACVGATATLHAVRTGQARELLIDAATTGGDPRQPLRTLPNGAARHERAPSGVLAGTEASLAEVLVHAAAATSTVVRTLRNGQRLRDGVGALLRPQDEQTVTVTPAGFLCSAELSRSSSPTGVLPGAGHRA